MSRGMMNRWHALSAQDQRAIGIVLVVILIAMYYLLIFAPLSARHTEDEKRLVSMQKTLIWMQTAAIEAKRLQAIGVSAVPRAGRRSLLALVDQTARDGKLGKALKRVEPRSNGLVRVWLEKAVFDDVLRWLVVLNTEGAVVTQFSMSAEDTAGLATVRLSVALQENAQ